MEVRYLEGFPIDELDLDTIAPGAKKVKVDQLDPQVSRTVTDEPDLVGMNLVNKINEVAAFKLDPDGRERGALGDTQFESASAECQGALSMDALHYHGEDMAAGQSAGCHVGYAGVCADYRLDLEKIAEPKRHGGSSVLEQKYKNTGDGALRWDDEGGEDKNPGMVQQGWRCAVPCVQAAYSFVRNA